jgi:hypothetical protein
MLRRAAAGSTRLVVSALMLMPSMALGQTSRSCQHQTLGGESSSIVPSCKRITGRQRLSWLVGSTIGPQSLAAGVLSSGIGTAADTPREYHGTWEGFGKRYGMRLTGISTGNAIESGLGAIWGEDPRYFRVADKTIGPRVRNVIAQTFVACPADGSFAPAYARYIATAGSNFLSNTWRADSEANVRHALIRTLYGFLGRMGSNAFQEFWPDIRRRAFRRNKDH